VRKSGSFAPALKIGIKRRPASWAGLRSDSSSVSRFGGLGFSLAVEEIGEFEAEVCRGFVGVGESRFQKSMAPEADQLFQFSPSKYCMPSVVAVAHSVEERLAFALALFDIIRGCEEWT